MTARISSPPVIAIDGPSASGKGTVAQRVAQALGFHYLDSGALYRLRPDGQTETFVTLGFPAYGHGVEWGNGIGGWSETSLFLPQPYDSNTVLELELGVPGREALYR